MGDSLPSKDALLLPWTSAISIAHLSKRNYLRLGSTEFIFYLLSIYSYSISIQFLFNSYSMILYTPNTSCETISIQPSVLYISIFQLNSSCDAISIPPLVLYILISYLLGLAPCR